MATHSNTLAWEILWTEEPDGLQSMGSQRGGHDLATEHAHTSTTRKVTGVPAGGLWEAVAPRRGTASHCPLAPHAWGLVEDAGMGAFISGPFHLALCTDQACLKCQENPQAELEGLVVSSVNAPSTANAEGTWMGRHWIWFRGGQVPPIL